MIASGPYPEATLLRCWSTIIFVCYLYGFGKLKLNSRAKERKKRGNPPKNMETIGLFNLKSKFPNIYILVETFCRHIQRIMNWNLNIKRLWMVQDTLRVNCMKTNFMLEFIKYGLIIMSNYISYIPFELWINLGGF